MTRHEGSLISAFQKNAAHHWFLVAAIVLPLLHNHLQAQGSFNFGGGTTSTNFVTPVLTNVFLQPPEITNLWLTNVWPILLTNAPPGPPANDNFADAGILTGASVQANANILSATSEAGEPAHRGAPA